LFHSLLISGTAKEEVPGEHRCNMLGKQTVKRCVGLTRLQTEREVDVSTGTAEPMRMLRSLRAHTGYAIAWNLRVHRTTANEERGQLTCKQINNEL
jgi:hypothetical protein